MTDLPEPGYYDFLDFNAPLSDGRADAIARQLAAGQPARVVDIGCGWGELLLRTLAAAPTAAGVGVDTDERVIERARANAVRRGLADRVTFTVEPAGATAEPADVVVCVGSDHAFGERQDAALKVLHDVVRPGGRLLFGTGFWERPPSEAEAGSIGMRPDSLHDLAGLVDLTIAAGFRPLFVQTANRDEWEQFEAGYLADWETWLVRYGNHPDASGVRERSDKHRNEWLHGWRNVLGFAYLTLGRPARNSA